MLKRKRIHNIEKIIKEGYGSGISEDYKLWVAIQDVPSLGRVTWVKVIKVEDRMNSFDIWKEIVFTY